MKLTRTDLSSLAVIAVGGLIGVAAFGPQHLMSTHTVVSTDWEYAPMRVVLPSGEAVPFDRDVMREGVVEFRRDRDRDHRRRRPDRDDRRRRRPHEAGEGAVSIEGVRVDTEHETVRVEGEPIVFVDGVQVMEMPDLDPDDIERIEVLKGPAAEALMGAEARNGVVQIFLKTPPASNPGG